MLLLPLLLLPLIELAVIIWVGVEIGFLRTIGLLVVIGVVGVVLLMRAGIGTARRFRQDLASGAVPDKPALDTLVIVFAGILLLVPGFVSDLIAIWLLLPPGRALARRSLARGRGRRAAANTMIFDVRGNPVPPRGDGPASDAAAPYDASPAERAPHRDPSDPRLPPGSAS